MKLKATRYHQNEYVLKYERIGDFISMLLQGNIHCVADTVSYICKALMAENNTDINNELNLTQQIYAVNVLI